MLKLDMRFDASEIERAFGLVENEHPLVLAKTLTQLGQEVRTAMTREIRTVFENPTNFTLRSLYLTPATKARLQAVVWLKDQGSKPHYLLPQIEGGGRPMKRFEEILLRAGIMSSNERAVPGGGAKLDAYGNMSRGQVVKILSQLKAFNLAGSDQNATDSKRSRAKRAAVEYFVSYQGASRVGRGAWKNGEKVQHLPRGIWARHRFAVGSAVKPVLLFVKGARYTKRFDFYGVAQGVIEARFKSIYTQRMQALIAKAGLSKGAAS